MVFRDFSHVNYAELSRLWAETYPSKYALDMGLIMGKTTESDVFDRGASMLTYEGDTLVGWLAAKKPGHWRDAPGHSAYITGMAARDEDIAVAMLHHFEGVVRPRRLLQMQFAGDPDHLMPGCPDEAELVCNALDRAGFAWTALAYDVERDLSDYEPPAGALESLTGCVVRRSQATDGPAIDEFFGRAFPGRWRYDVMHHHAKHPQDVVILATDERVEGFALTQRSSDLLPIAGGVWRNALGYNWAALGPIGLSEDVRGRGWGNGLLAWALNDMKQQGAQRTVIDWTVLLDFYGRHGFQPTRAYRNYTKRLT